MILAQVVNSAPDLFTIVKQVHDFYNDAWNSLLWSFGIFGGILIFFLGVVLPWWSERSRRESFKLDKEAILAEIHTAREEMQREVADAGSLFKENLKDTLKEIAKVQEEARRQIEEQSGDLWWAHAFQCMRVGDPFCAMYRALAIHSYASAGTENGLAKAGGELNCLAALCSDSKNPLKSYDSVVLGIIVKAIGAVEKAGWAERYSKDVKTIKDYLQSRAGDSSSPKS